jgi:hypothetical protein
MPGPRRGDILGVLEDPLGGLMRLALLAQLVTNAALGFSPE